MNANVDFREPIIQILAEPPGGDHRVDILMRRAHDPRVDGNLLAPADPLDHALLQETQQLDLERQRNVADFVEEQRDPRRLYDLAAPGLDRAGDRQSAVWGKSVTVRVDRGGSRTIK